MKSPFLPPVDSGMTAISAVTYTKSVFRFTSLREKFLFCQKKISPSVMDILVVLPKFYRIDRACLLTESTKYTP